MKDSFRTRTTMFATLLAIGAAGSAAAHPLEDPGDPESAAVTRAIAVLHPTEGSEAHGVVELVQTDDGLQMSASVKGLSPGGHGTHVHLFGDCSAPDGTSAGTHYNFRGSARNPGEGIDHITGDLGDLVADESGKATREATIPHATLHGPYSVLGRAIIVHAKPNDPASPPIGAAGSRVACGVIGVDEASSPP